VTGGMLAADTPVSGLAPGVDSPLLPTYICATEGTIAHDTVMAYRKSHSTLRQWPWVDTVNAVALGARRDRPRGSAKG